jgi:molecular chaperone HtpG
MTKTVQPEQMEFQAEVKQVLDLVINSLYSNKEIFLRELVSNSSDAIDKARIESLKNVDLLGDDKEFKIKIELDKEGKTLTIRDNGIGMNRDELIANIGTIAKSGTKEFLKQLKESKEQGDSQLIGQFGVGFYSVFMVADKVTLTTKRMGSEESAIQWVSAGEGNYTLEEVDKVGRGTEIKLHLKEDELQFTEDWQVRSIVKKYNSYIPHPIAMDTEKEVGEGDDKAKEVVEEILNDKPPIWRRGKTDIKKEEYTEFYKHLSYDQEEPLATIHNKAEGTLEYTTLMYIPSKAPYDLFQPEKVNGLSLYVKRIFIMNDCKELLPNYLRFVKGIVDSEDLPLNVSREILQQNAVLTKIQKASTKKILSELEKMAKKRPEEYTKFWKEFGNVIKEGFHMNWENLDELKKLTRFQSSKSAEGEYRSLDQYLEGMQKEQKDIYYITGENRAAVDASPHLEVFKDKDIEVLYLVDPIDEWVVQSLTEYNEKKLVSIAKGDLDLGDLNKEEKKEKKDGEKKYKKFTEYLQKNFEDQLKEVRVTTRLKDSPSCLVSDNADMGANMERILKMANQDVSASKRILEINPKHPILENLNGLFEKDAEDPKLKEWSSVLLDQALLAEGSPIPNPTEFVSRVNTMLAEVSK